MGFDDRVVERVFRFHFSEALHLRHDMGVHVLRREIVRGNR